MKSEEYVIKQLKNLISIFPKLKVRYEFENMAKCHYIEVLPNDSFNFDQSYIQFENKLSNNFICSFPNETICFLSGNSLFEIEKSTFELKGLLHGVSYSELHYSEANLLNYLPILEIDRVFTLNTSISSSFVSSNKINSISNSKIVNDIDSNNESFEKENNRFAMAA